MLWRRMRLRSLRTGLKWARLGLLSLALLRIEAGLAHGEKTGSRPWKPEPGKSAGWVCAVDGTHLTMGGYDVLMNLIRGPLEEVMR